METWRIELRRAKVAYPNHGLIELQADAFVTPAVTEPGRTPTSWLVMTPEQARVLRGLLGSALGE